MPEAAREAVREVQASLERRVVGARWVPPENVHVTLAFIGSVPDARPFEPALAGVRARTGIVTLGSAGVFPQPRRARVVWLSLDDPEALVTAAAHAVTEALRPVGYVPEERPFRAHATIARLKRPAPVDVGAVVVPPIEVPVSHVTLFESRLARPSPVYRALARVPLAGSSGSSRT